MSQYISLDSQVRTRLRTWPQRPPGIVGLAGRGNWIRARPSKTDGHQPFLKTPGSDRLRTMPDGLWLNFGGSARDPFVDVFAIEACSSTGNLMDKRSRFAPSTQSLMVVCPLLWMLGAMGPNDDTQRWLVTGILQDEPAGQMMLPVRDMRVVYALKQRDYRGFASSQVPHPHEYFVTMDALVAERSYENPAMQALFARAACTANFLEMPPENVTRVQWRAAAVPERT